MCASNGIDASFMRRTGDHTVAISNAACGRASIRTREANAASAAWRKHALARRPAAHQRADCSRRARTAGRKEKAENAPRRAGAQNGSAASGTSRYTPSTSAPIAKAPR